MLNIKTYAFLFIHFFDLGIISLFRVYKCVTLNPAAHVLVSLCLWMLTVLLSVNMFRMSSVSFSCFTARTIWSWTRSRSRSRPFTRFCRNTHLCTVSLHSMCFWVSILTRISPRPSALMSFWLLAFFSVSSACLSKSSSSLSLAS